MIANIGPQTTTWRRHSPPCGTPVEQEYPEQAKINEDPKTHDREFQDEIPD